MTHEGEIIGMDKVTRVFSNIEDIVIIHDALLRQLEERIKLDESDRVGDIFLNMSFALKLYSRYIANFDVARETLEELTFRSKRWPGWLQEREESDAWRARFKGNNLASVMMMPVQRIPRYEMLLRDHFKYTTKLGERRAHEPDWMDELEQFFGPCTRSPCTLEQIRAPSGRPSCTSCRTAGGGSTSRSSARACCCARSCAGTCASCTQGRRAQRRLRAAAALGHAAVRDDRRERRVRERARANRPPFPG